MKFIRLLIKSIFGLTIVILLFISGVLWVDSINTDYLSIDRDDSSAIDTYLITNAHVIPMDQDTVLRNKMIFIQDGIIQEIADSILVNHVQVFDAKNNFVVPGLIDMHVHVWDRYELGLYLSNGVTAVRNLWGMPMHLRIKNDIAANRIYSPHFITSGPKLTGSEFIGDDNLNLYHPTEARKKIIRYKERGYDLIKTYYGLEKEIFDAVIEQAIISGMDIASHPSQKVPFSYHAHPQIKSIEHAEEIVQQPLSFNLDTLQLKTIVDTLSKFEHVRYSPTLTVFNNIYQMMMDEDILDSELLGYMNPLIKKVDTQSQYDRWFTAKQNDSTVVERIKNQDQFHRTILGKLHEANISIISGTDAGIGVTVPGFSIHQELAFYKESGLSNYEVLKTATVNPSKTHAIFNNLGTIQEGKLANILILESNPLMDIAALEQPAFVFIKGRQLNRTTLDNYEQKALNRNNLIATGIRYIENLLVEK